MGRRECIYTTGSCFLVFCLHDPYTALGIAQPYNTGRSEFYWFVRVLPGDTFLGFCTCPRINQTLFSQDGVPFVNQHRVAQSCEQHWWLSSQQWLVTCCPLFKNFLFRTYSNTGLKICSEAMMTMTTATLPLSKYSNWGSSRIHLLSCGTPKISPRLIDWW